MKRKKRMEWEEKMKERRGDMIRRVRRKRRWNKKGKKTRRNRRK